LNEKKGRKEKSVKRTCVQVCVCLFVCLLYSFVCLLFEKKEKERSILIHFCFFSEFLKNKQNVAQDVEDDLDLLKLELQKREKEYIETGMKITQTNTNIKQTNKHKQSKTNKKPNKHK